MSALPIPRLTIDEYVARERVATYKSEYYCGEVFAMSGGSPRHNIIGGNIFARLHSLLRGKPCRPHNSDQRIYIPAVGLGTYPDTSIVCHPREFDVRDRDAITNPRVVFEVLSKSTESYDRGKKFAMYRQLASLREYVLVSQEEAQVERFLREADGVWQLTIYSGLEAILPLESVDCSLPLAEIYEDVEFGPEENTEP